MFLVPVRVLRTVFRKKFLAGLCHLYRKGACALNLGGSAAPSAILRRSSTSLRSSAKRTGTKTMLGAAASAAPRTCAALPRRYTHRMAISNHRITAFDGERVSFLWRDYAHGGKQKVMTLDAVNFLCRFFLHVRCQKARAHPPLWPALQPLPQRAAATSLAHTARRTGPRTAASSATPTDCARGTVPAAEKPCGVALSALHRCRTRYFAGLDSS